MSALDINHPASGAPIWMKCAGQPQMVKKVNFEDPNKTSRLEGLAAHWVADTYLRSTPTIETHKNETEITDEMHEGATIFRDDVDLILSQCSEGNRVKFETNIEYSCDVSHLLPDVNRQRIDFRHYDPVMKTLYIWDYKFGHTPVEVEFDDQTIYYALDYATKDEVQNVVRTIVQPRSFHRDGVVRRHVMNREELNKQAMRFRAQYDLSYQPDAPLVPGSHCHNCLPRGICPGLYEEVLKLATVLDAAASLTPQDVGDRLALMRNLHERAGDAKSALEIQGIHYVKNGQPVPGFKLADKIVKSTLSNESLLVNAAPMFGVNVEQLYQKKLKTQTDLKKLLPAPMIKMCTTVPKAGETLVPDDDSRQGHPTRAEMTFGALPNKPEGAL